MTNFKTKLVSALLACAMAIPAVPAGITGKMTASAATANWKFDFGNSGVSSGYTGVTAATGYNSSLGYGFAQTGNVSDVNAGGSGAGSDAVSFNSDDAANTFNVDLPKGLYEVTVTVGNAPRCSIKMEGMMQIMNLTRLNATETIQLPVTDGQLNIQAVTGIKNGQRSISAIEIKQLNTTGEMNPHLWICGDSTVANYYNQADTAQHGWGQLIKNYLSGTPLANYTVRNMATSGQYAKGFVDGGQFVPIETYGGRSMEKKIKIKYFNDKIEKLQYIDGKSDWIDLRSAEDVDLKEGEFHLIPLGVAMEIPSGYEAHIVPRSSTFKNFGIIQANHMGIVDHSYCGDNDQWFMPVIAMRDTHIGFNDRICQFRIMENQPTIVFEECDHLEGADRGGFGSTGTK